ncbi:MAG: nucleotidyltransferase, partial [Oscillospiraceae bacterium]|nr:nucleotidyltransferase [Oscillospiraceae bacterium]
RGVCREKDGFLTAVTDRTRIEKRGEDASYTEDGETWVPLAGDTPVSMNCWGFGHSLLQELNDRFSAWLDQNLPANPLKCEYFLPFVVNDLIQEKKAAVRLLNCHETWYGMTYKEDLQTVRDAIAVLRDQGVYPETLLD